MDESQSPPPDAQPTAAYVADMPLISAPLSSSSDTIHSKLPQESSHRLSHFERLPLELRHLIYFHLFNRQGKLDIVVRYSDMDTWCKTRTSRMLRSLLLVSRHISSDTRLFFFERCNFCFVRSNYGHCSAVITLFKKCIRWKNVALIRKVTLPVFSTITFGDMDSDEELEELQTIVEQVGSFPALTHFHLGLDIVKCLPCTYELRGFPKDTSKDTLMLGDWQATDPEHPMHQSLSEFKRSGRLDDVNVGVYWTHFFASRILDDSEERLYGFAKAECRARFLVVLRDWLGISSVMCLGPLKGYRMCREECCIQTDGWDDDDSDEDLDL